MSATPQTGEPVTSTALDRIGRTQQDPAALHVSQATAIEQSRAIAEVQAAVTVAQRIPRDMTRAIGNMQDSCRRLGLATRAFYTVPNRGHGPSVHLARELARIWGNVQYGVHELRRDDEAGESEVQAFAWDLETNTRSTRTFIAPHARMKGKERQRLTDLNDIYLSNQNVGARAVRECIFTVLPTWLTEEAQDLCRKTLEHGEGKPLPERIGDAINLFGGLGISLPQLEQKIGKRRSAWNAGDVAELAIAYTSITRDGIRADELFEQGGVTAAEIASAGAPSMPAPPTLAPSAEAEPTPDPAPAPAPAPDVDSPDSAAEPSFDQVREQITSGGESNDWPSVAQPPADTDVMEPPYRDGEDQ